LFDQQKTVNLKEINMRFKKIKNGVLFGLLVICGASFGMEISVGRATISLNGDKWQLAGEENKSSTFTGGREGGGSQGATQKTYFLADEAGKLKAVLKIDATNSGTTSPMRFTGGCEAAKSATPNRNAVVIDATGGSVSAMDCLRIYNVLTPMPFLAAVLKSDWETIKVKNLQLPKKMVFVSQFVTTSNGTYLGANLFADDTWVGAPSNSTEANTTTAIPPEALAWGKLLAQASRDSVRSFSGKMQMPDIEFKQ
jgi:hypothetical protein